MRVIAGKARGSKLKSIDLPSTRPTLDRVKESIFSTIQYNLKNKICLDAFSCTGSLGIEALSRGACSSDFCEKDNRAFAVLRENLTKTRLLSMANIYNCDIFEFLKDYSKKYDFIFADPPYNKGLILKFIEALIYYDHLNEGAIIVCEHEKTLCFDNYYKKSLNKEIVFIKEKKFSDTTVSYFEVNNIV